MDDKRKPDENDQGVDFLLERLSDEDLEDVSGGQAETSCVGGAGCCDGFAEST